MATESTLRQPLVKALRKTGAKVTPIVGSTMGIKGTSDVFLASKLWHGWIEFKGPKTKIEPIQLEFIKDHRARLVNAVFLRLLDNNNILLDEQVPFRWETGWDILKRLCEHDCLSIEALQGLL